jgi:CDP-2,3-bis-(O-geranylgeranyl)-sn-glycerol synthase
MDWLSINILFLIVVANSAPVMARKLLDKKLATPLDGGRLWSDGQPLLGRSKTIRGLLAAIVATAVVAYGLGLGLIFGALFGALAMLGDLISSFIKRRRGLPSSSRSRGLDQIPEALLPAAFAMLYFNLTLLDLIVVVALFFVLAVTLSPLLFRLGLRRRPY